MDKQCDKNLEGVEDSPKMEIHIDIPKTTLKISNWKKPGYDGINDFWFEKFTSINDRRELEMNRRLLGARIPE